jgi:hypothetical protein
MDKSDKSEPMQSIDIHYIKIPSYRTFCTSGAFGGITPKGQIYMELFVERAATPQVVTHQINDNGSLGKELKRQGKVGVVREIECGIVFDIGTAKSMKRWLEDKINEYDKLLQEVKGNKNGKL